MLKFSKLASVATSNETAYTENGINQTTAFMCMCYNMANATRMIDAEIKVWTTRTGRRTASKMPKLCLLSPTTEAFRENGKHAPLSVYHLEKNPSRSPKP